MLPSSIYAEPTKSSSSSQSSPLNNLRYYYEDGRGNRVWVQNLTLDYDVRRLNNNNNKNNNWYYSNNFNTTISKTNHYEDPSYMIRQPPRAASVYRHKSPISNKVLSNNDKIKDKGEERRYISPSRIGKVSKALNRCTCFCPLHSEFRKETTNKFVDPNKILAWTFLPEKSIENLIHSIDDAEYILEELRNEEQMLKNTNIR